MEELMTEKENVHKIRDYQTTVTILEHLSDAVFILSPQGHIQYANRVATDLLGQPFNAVLGKNLNDYLSQPFESHSEKEAKGQGFLNDIYRQGLKEIENAFTTKGYQIPVLLSFGIIRNRDERVQYIIASAKDVSLRKNLEKERLQKQLLAQSRDRYRELGELAINIVHRLSQPITSIQLLNEMTRKALQNPEFDLQRIQENLGQISEMLNEMSEVINNVRNFAFLTEEETLKPVRLETVIEEAIRQLHYELTEANLSINIQLPDSLPSVMANALHLQQVFMTILRLFIETGGKDKNPPGLNIRLQNIRNQHVEIALFQKDLQHISRGDKTGKPNALIDENINLTIIQLIMTSFGGDFNYRNTEGNGPVFVLRLPADQQNERDMLLNLIDLMK